MIRNEGAAGLAPVDVQPAAMYTNPLFFPSAKDVSFALPAMSRTNRMQGMFLMNH